MPAAQNDDRPLNPPAPPGEPEPWTEEYRQLVGLLSEEAADLIQDIEDCLDKIYDFAEKKERYYIAEGEKGKLPDTRDWAQIAVAFDNLARFSKKLSLRLALTSHPRVIRGRPSPIPTRLLRESGASDSFIRSVQRAKKKKKESQKKD